MCHKCDEREAKIRSMTENIIDAIRIGEGVVTHREAIALLVGTACGIASSHKMSKEEFNTLVEEIYSDANASDEAEIRGLH